MSEADQQGKRVEKERKRQREHEQAIQGLKFDDEGRLSGEFIESMVDTSQLQGRTIDLLQNYLSRQWVLGNMSNAETHDMQYKLEVMKYKVLGSHPPAESEIRGPLRAYLWDDPQAELEPLTDSERNVIDSLFDSLRMAIIPRGRDGFERTQLNTQVRESRTRRADERMGDEAGGGLFTGLFK